VSDAEFARIERDVGIKIPCRKCHKTTLFIGNGGHLTCSLIGCARPNVETAIRFFQSGEMELESQRGISTPCPECRGRAGNISR